MIKPHQPTLFLLLILLNLCLILLPQQAAAQINASIDRNPVNLNESFQIIFTATDTPDGEPDFSPLEQDFSILNQSQSSSSSWINGKSSNTIQWTLNVMAKDSGSLVIPAIQFGADASRAITVLITQDTGQQANEDLFLEVDATPENPYIQSQVIYTLRLYTRIDIAQARLNEPELADAVVEKLGDDSNYNTQVKGVAYSVTERKYAVFPQKSGLLTIKPLVLTAEVLATNNRPLFNGFFNSQMTQTKRVESKAVTLQVKPAPATLNGRHWLTAEQLELKQQWSGDVQTMKVGEPLTRTLTLQAKGTTVSQLPELGTIKTDGPLKSYPDQPILKEQKNADGLSAYREEKIALIPSKAGHYTLPAIEIPWFNTHSQKMEIAKIPETVITAISATDTGRQTPTAVIKAVKPDDIEPAPLIQAQVPEQTGNYWPGVSMFLAAGWLFTLIYFLAKRPAKKPAVKNINEADEIRYKDNIKRLKKACADNNAEAAKNALLEWGRQQFDVTSLGAVAMSCDARLRDEILFLNQLLYGKETGQWTGKRLFQAFTENKARAKLAITEDNSLKPLYRL